MKAKLINEVQEFKRGINSKRALDLGISPQEWGKRMEKELLKYGIKGDFTDNMDISGEVMDIPKNKILKSNFSVIYNEGIWIGITEKEWYIVSDVTDDRIHTQKDKNLEEFISKIVQFEYAKVKNEILSIADTIKDNPSNID